MSVAVLITTWVASPVQPAHAERVRDIYASEVIVASRRDDDRQRASGWALIRVLLRLTGWSELPHNPVLDSVRNDASAYLRSHRYSTIQFPDGRTEIVLSVLFEPSYVEELMREAGLKLWPANRSNIVVWGLRDGREPVLLNPDNAPALTELARSYSRQYALPVRLPLMDLEDTRNLSPKQLLAGNFAQVRRASRRYLADSILVGVLNGADEIGWSARWQYLFRNEQLELSVSGPTAAATLRSALDAVRTYISGRQALGAEAFQPENVLLQISGIDNFRDYVGALHFLRELDLARNVVPLEVTADEVLFVVDAGVNSTALSESISLDRRVEPLPAPSGSGRRTAVGSASSADEEGGETAAAQQAQVFYYNWLGR